MNRLHVTLSLLLLPLLALTGCAGIGTASFPDASENAAQITISGLQGSNYGGHAPLAGAHIYVVEPGTASYGSTVKGLLTASTGVSGFTTVKNGSWSNGPTTSDNFVPATDSQGNPFYGVQADSTGNFQLGSFVCDPGSPVIIVGYGGSPTFPSGSNVFTTTSVNVAGPSPYTVTFTVNSLENAYIGESFTIGTGANGLVGTGLATLNGTTGTVIATNLTTTTFAITSTNALTAGTYAQTNTNQITLSPTFNPSAVNMAVVGNCPSSAPFNFSTSSSNPVKYVYMNEVSTTAAAYAFAGFVSSTAHPQSGYDPFHIGSSGTTQAKLGLFNAALTANNLYDITGGNISTSYAGEGHIARTTTVGSNATTTATVPQANIDTIANILAACVDSNNTFVVTSGSGVSPITTSGTLSAQCQTLFQYATDNGVHDTSTYNYTLPATGHQPFNIAQAAFSMARYPQGNGVGSTNASGVQTVSSAQSTTNAANFVTALYGLPTGNVPFTPNLVSTGAGAPNSFAIPILYSNTTMATPYRNAIDSKGNIWVVGNGQTYALKFDNLGVQQYSLTGVDSGVSIAIDQTDNAWVASTTNSTVQEFSSTGTTLQAGLTPTGINAPYAIAVDGNNDVWVGNESSTNIIKMTNGGALSTSFADGDANEVEGMAFDSTGAVWIPNVGNANIQKIPTGDNAITYNVTGSGLASTSRIVVDASNNAWVEDITGGQLAEFSSTGTLKSGTAGFKVAGGNGTNPEGLGVDGNSDIYECFAGTAGSTATTSSVAKFDNDTGAYIFNITTSANGSRGCQVDPSGNLWIVQNGSTPAYLVEYVGIAVPVVTPTSLGVKNTTLGTKP